MPTTLVLGASGQIGRFLVPALLDQGHAVIALSRRPRTALRAGLQWQQGELFGGMPELPRLDAIFSLGPLDGFSGWLERTPLPGRPRIVAIGSMSAVSKHDSTDPAERALANTLQRAEQRMCAAAERNEMAWTLLRPTLIYGAGIDRSLSQLAHWATRWRLFPRLIGASGLRQPVHAEDLANACLASLTGGAENRSFDLGGGERLSVSAMLERVQASLPKRALGVPLPFAAARLALACARMHPRWRSIHPGALHRLRADLLADDDAARALIGWMPRPFRPVPATWRAEHSFEY
ncbi:MAG: NAD(P)-dependent oxidoreductase [Xanthomonadales bacterium]|nr:NAD(P)-dependent oxidoreductase [Xanthomonadales bacterium]